MAVWQGASDPLVCVDVVRETGDVTSFHFQAQSGAAFEFLAGQHIILDVPVDNRVLRRAFTIASSPTRSTKIALTIKRQPDGQGGTKWLHDQMKPGTTLTAQGPFGRFVLSDRTATDPLLLISAGSGATPMLSMARWLYDLRVRRKVHFIQFARTSRDFLGKEEIDSFASILQDWRVDWFATRGDVASSSESERPIWPHFWSMLFAEQRNALTYCCGPATFMESVRQAHTSAGLPPSAFKTESFGVDPTALAVKADISPERYTITFAASGKQKISEPGETILKTARRAGVPLPSACEQGICSTCKVRKHAGDVAMDHQGGIDPEDVEDGYILACCSYPRSEVTVDV